MAVRSFDMRVEWGKEVVKHVVTLDKVTVLNATTVQIISKEFKGLVRIRGYCMPELPVDKARANSVALQLGQYMMEPQLHILSKGVDGLGRTMADIVFSLLPEWANDAVLSLHVPPDSPLHTAMYPQLTMSEFMVDNAPVSPPSNVMEIKDANSILTSSN